MEAETLKTLIKDSQKTKKLDLSHNGLDEVPQEVIKLRHLEVLDLSNNNLTSLPEEMFKGNNALLELDISRNKLRSLPESLGTLALTLRNLNISSNMLKTIPTSMEGFFADPLQTVYTNYGRYYKHSNELKKVINLSGNPDLDIKEMVDADQRVGIKNLLERRREQEEEQRKAQNETKAQRDLVDRELRAEEKKDRQRERKNSEKSRTKNLRTDRND